MDQRWPQKGQCMAGSHDIFSLRTEENIWFIKNIIEIHISWLKFFRYLSLLTSWLWSLGDPTMSQDWFRQWFDADKALSLALNQWYTNVWLQMAWICCNEVKNNWHKLSMVDLFQVTNTMKMFLGLTLYIYQCERVQMNGFSKHIESKDANLSKIWAPISYLSHKFNWNRFNKHKNRLRIYENMN